jgi:Lamin Tail Domain
MHPRPLLLLLALACGGKEETTGEGATLAECQDGVDNDNNGTADCDDAGCEIYADCASGSDGSDGADGATGGDGADGADGTTDSGGNDGGGISDTGISSDEGGGSDGGGSDIPLVVINEFMATNATILTDESGAYPDWIELYNASTEAVNLSGWTISDDLAVTDKHTLGDLTIEAGGYLILYADGDVADGANHLGFSLSAGGEDLGLYYTDGTATSRIQFGDQVTDVSAARTPDGSETWEYTDAPTPGASNGG